MGRYLAKRLLQLLPILLIILVLNFILIHLAPGDPVQVIAGEMGGASADVIAALNMPAARTALEKLGAVIVGSTPEELGAVMRATHDKWGPIIREAGIKGGD